MRKIAFALVAHPDDVEFTQAGTLLLLKQAGWEIHYMTLANGSCGDMVLSAKEIISKREKESQNACKILGATWHPSLVNDFEIFVTHELIAKVAAVIRKIKPTILLLPHPNDYMLDHCNTAIIGAEAAFVRAMPNYKTNPVVSAIPDNDANMAVYHSQPHGNADMLYNAQVPDFVIDVLSVYKTKIKALRAHESQREFLQKQQGFDVYDQIMLKHNFDCAELFGSAERLVEGWTYHNHLGFGPVEFDPLKEVLEEYIIVPPGKKE
jgi:LmbE family N-acetylglucosaminyl deacetylase